MLFAAEASRDGRAEGGGHGLRFATRHRAEEAAASLRARCRQGAGLRQGASGRRCCIRTSFSPRPSGGAHRAGRALQPSARGGGGLVLSHETVCESKPAKKRHRTNRNIRRRRQEGGEQPACEPAPPPGGRLRAAVLSHETVCGPNLRRSAIVRIATFADGGRTGSKRLACEPAVRRMGRRRTAHAARDLFSALRQCATAD